MVRKLEDTSMKSKAEDLLLALQLHLIGYDFQDVCHQFPRVSKLFQGYHQVPHGREFTKHILYIKNHNPTYSTQSCNTFGRQGSICLATILFSYVFYPSSQLPRWALGNQQDLPAIELQNFLAQSETCYHQVCKILPSVVRSQNQTIINLQDL